jgi:hypothetical protein
VCVILLSIAASAVTAALTGGSQLDFIQLQR